MSRADVLVDADWAEAHLEDPNIVFVEVDEDVSAYDGGTSPAPSAWTGPPSCSRPRRAT
jgi:3-mercaptopyruvate sulfurtransferase SseA